MSPTSVKASHVQLILRVRREYRCLVRKLGIGNVRLQKVKGHSGHAWNDIADALAGAARDGASALRSLGRGEVILCLP